MWNGKNNSAVQCMCIGRYLHTYLIYTEKCGALLENKNVRILLGF
jgi:hypothetical protein